MATQTQTQNPTEQSTSSLVGGIIDDMQDLVKQQIQLTRKEITAEVRQAYEALQLCVLGGACLFLGLIFSGLSLVHLLHWVSSPAGSDVGMIPLWACHAIVGVPLALLGAALTWWARDKAGSIDPMHNPATEAMAENVKWATNTK